MKRLVGLLVLTSQVAAQKFRASISGQVTNSTGALIAGASVTVTNLERNAVTQTVSNNVGMARAKR